jgi:hypothetical protein
MLRQHRGEGGPGDRASPLQIVSGYVQLHSQRGLRERCWFAPGQRGELSTCRRCRSRLLILARTYRVSGESGDRDT